MEQLKNLISQGNLKIGKDTLIFNMTPAKNCPAERLDLCKHSNICYAKKAERMYKQVLPFRIRQAKYWKACNVDQFVNEFIEIVTRKQIKIKYLRFSESGDFETQSDVDKLSIIAECLKAINVKVYTHTARKDLNFSKVSDNLTVSGSGFMIHNNFSVTKDKKLVNCPADCKKCHKCKVSKGKLIYALKH